MLNKQSVAMFVVLIISVLLLIGCSNNADSTQPVTNSSGNTTVSTLASSVSQSELTLLRFAGIDNASGKGIFSIGWRQMFDPRNQTETTMGQAMAIGFDSSQSATSRRAGIDMGSVYLNYASNHLALQKHTSPHGGVMYSTMAGLREGGTSVPFISNGTYEFEVSGSDNFTALRTTITAPAGLIDITSPAKGDSIDSANDLTLTWLGGNTMGGVVIAIVALPPRPAEGPLHGPGGFDGPPPPPGGGDGHRGPGGGGPPPGGDHPPMLDSTKAIIVKLNTNPGTYTVTASALQDLISRTGMKGLMCTVSQVTVNDVDHDGGIVHVVVRNGDGVMVKIK